MSDEWWRPIDTLPEEMRVILGVWKGDFFHSKIGYLSAHGGFPGWTALVMPEIWHVLPAPPPPGHKFIRMFTNARAALSPSSGNESMGDM